jgi:CheY-like chemotaxis protein
MESERENQMPAGVTSVSTRAPTAGVPHDDVLLVEDDDLVRYGLKRLLTSGGRVCVAVASAEEAQQLLAVHEPALVITDFNLSGRWNGIDLLLWIWRSPRLHDVPMLLMTGDHPAETRFLLDAVGLAHVDVLCKPFEAGELKEALSRTVARSGPRSSKTKNDQPPTVVDR